MGTVTREQLPAYALPQQDVDVPPLGGSVVVRGLDMPQLMQFVVARRRLQVPRDGETDEQAGERANAQLLPVLLGMAVLLDDGEPAMPATSWAAFGARHPEEAVTLFQAAMKLSGQDAEAEKKT